MQLQPSATGHIIYGVASRRQSHIYCKSPNYWRGKPHVAQLNVRIVPDPQTNLVLLRSGPLDWNLIAPSQRSQLTGVEFRPSSDFGRRWNRDEYTAFPARTTFACDAPLQCRSTVQVISKDITLGAYPVTNMLQPQFSWAYDPSIREPGYNPVQADHLLDEAGWHRKCRQCASEKQRAARANLRAIPRNGNGSSCCNLRSGRAAFARL